MLMLMREQTTVMNHLKPFDQFCGLVGSFGPSQVTRSSSKTNLGFRVCNGDAKGAWTRLAAGGGRAGYVGGLENSCIASVTRGTCGIILCLFRCVFISLARKGSAQEMKIVFVMQLTAFEGRRAIGQFTLPYSMKHGLENIHSSLKAQHYIISHLLQHV